jgi:hypothetical protein
MERIVIGDGPHQGLELDIDLGANRVFHEGHVYERTGAHAPDGRAVFAHVGRESP